MLDGEEADLGKALKKSSQDQCERPRAGTRFLVVDDEASKPRSDEVMSAEAEMLASEMEKEPLD